jgi:hypothetical protein
MQAGFWMSHLAGNTGCPLKPFSGFLDLSGQTGHVSFLKQRTAAHIFL